MMGTNESAQQIETAKTWAHLFRKEYSECSHWLVIKQVSSKPRATSIVCACPFTYASNNKQCTEDWEELDKTRNRCRDADWGEEEGDYHYELGVEK